MLDLFSLSPVTSSASRGPSIFLDRRVPDLESIKVTATGKRQFVPRDQVLSLNVV